jgi:hypothetical protein
MSPGHVDTEGASDPLDSLLGSFRGLAISPDPVGKTIDLSEFDFSMKEEDDDGKLVVNRVGERWEGTDINPNAAVVKSLTVSDESGERTVENPNFYAGTRAMVGRSVVKIGLEIGGSVITLTKGLLPWDSKRMDVDRRAGSVGLLFVDVGGDIVIASYRADAAVVTAIQDELVELAIPLDGDIGEALKNISVLSVSGGVSAYNALALNDALGRRQIGECIGINFVYKCGEVEEFFEVAAEVEEVKGSGILVELRAEKPALVLSDAVTSGAKLAMGTISTRHS